MSGEGVREGVEGGGRGWGMSRGSTGINAIFHLWWW